LTTRIGTSNLIEPSAANGSRQHGFVTANLLQRDDWQREAARQSELRQALRTAAADEPAHATPLRPGRVSVAIGGALVRLGTRLQGGTQTPVPTPAR
jgi:hypothetical protein